MSAKNVLSEPGREWHFMMPATDAEIAELVQQTRIDLPSEYLDLLRSTNGGEGPLALKPLYFRLYSVQDCIESLHDNFERLDLLEYMVFGSNGGLELIAFDLRSGPPWAIVMIDPIAGPDSIMKIARDIETFVEAIGREFQT